MKNRYGLKRGPIPRLQSFWDARAACNFIGGGTGTGLIIVAGLYAALGQPVLALPLLGLVAVAFGLFMVFMEIGRPWRSMNVFFNPQTSWMTREGIVALPLFFFGGVAVLLHGTALGNTASVLAGLSAACYLYCQMRMLHACKGILSWCEPALKPYMLVTGVVEGLGVALCVPAVTGDKAAWSALAALLLLRALLWFGYAAALHGNRAPEDSRAEIDRLRWPYMLLGHLLPVLLLCLALLMASGLPAIVAGLLAASSGWYVKLMIITRAAQTRGFAIPRTPVRGRGESRVLSS
ncbi:MAG: dimethyl sulfoxide reductase anchor subunit [Pseudomonadales bacterium]|nr:dimethyl sulfoxide reductase anchor subunit [Halioglobus sp.]MCP5194644.1 dimethyl sulfoxide reductase anchor subunit [Pseudomonadales bacterium]